MSDVNIVEFISNVMTSEDLAEGPIVVQSAKLNKMASVYGILLEPGLAEKAWQQWHSLRQKTGLIPCLTSIKSSEQAFLSLADSSVQEDTVMPQEELHSYRAERRVADIVARVAARSIAKAQGDYPEEVEEERQLHDPKQLAELLEAETGAVLTGDSLAFQERWGMSPLWLLLVEARAGFSLPTLLPNFASNARTAFPDSQALSSADHCAFLEHWNHAYGAEVFFMTSTEVQMQVSRPPVRREKIAELAIEHHAYSDDLDHVVDTGNTQARSTVWSFWWD
ncbi:DUF4253 domain-containing protein [Streptomyces microflavus]